VGTLLIGYDLDKPGQSYSPLYEAIKGLGSWWHYLDSTWLVSTSISASAARNRLRPHIDTNDKLLGVRRNRSSRRVGGLQRKSCGLAEGTLTALRVLCAVLTYPPA
jgi:hypothetical protein